MKNKDIIVVGQQPWDIEIGSNCKNIALEFSKQNRVLYVNPPLDRITSLRNRKDKKVIKRLKVINGEINRLITIKDNLWNLFPDKIIESINWIRSQWLYDFVNRINNDRLAYSILQAVKILGFTDFILFNDGDIFRSFYLIDLIKPKLSIYYSRDNLLATDYYKYHGRKLEPLLIEKSSLCVANSTYLTEYCKQYNQQSFFIGQGCEPLFAQCIPQELVNINRPVIGYVGALLGARLDIELLIEISKTNSAWQVVLVGPEDELFKKSELHQLSNVHFLGPKSPELLADYISGFDVCINPQLLNSLTIGNYPRKVDEYLFMGKPVVATETEAMDVFRDFVYLACSKNEFSELIAKSLAQNSEVLKNSRQKFAASHSWENSVQEIYNAVDKVTP